MADPTDAQRLVAAPEGTAWLNPNDLPGGAQVRYWPYDEDGPSELPVSLETPGSHTDLSREDAARLGRALIAAADMPAPDVRERIARHLFLSERTDEWAPREWDMPQHVNKEPYLRRADVLLAVITGKGN